MNSAALYCNERLSPCDQVCDLDLLCMDTPDEPLCKIGQSKLDPYGRISREERIQMYFHCVSGSLGYANQLLACPFVAVKNEFSFAVSLLEFLTDFSQKMPSEYGLSLISYACVLIFDIDGKYPGLVCAQNFELFFLLAVISSEKIIYDSHFDIKDYAVLITGKTKRSCRVTLKSNLLALIKAEKIFIGILGVMDVNVPNTPAVLGEDVHMYNFYKNVAKDVIYG